MKYPYIAGALKLRQLHEEIVDAGVPGLVGLHHTGSSLDVEVEAELSVEDKATLDAAIAAHVPVEPPPPKLWSFLDPSDVGHEVTSINYKTATTIRLAPKRTFVKGELQCVEWFETEEPQGTFANLIVKEDHVYTRNALGIALSRDITISWYDTADNVYASKVRHKKYNPTEQIQEGKRRRQNNIDSVQINTVGMIMATEAVDQGTAIGMAVAFQAEHAIELQLYVDTEADNFRQSVIADATHAWLDNPINPDPLITIRDYIAGELEPT